MVDVSGLELREYKGYKDICLTINDDVKTGKSKQYQIREWRRYFDWTERTRYKWEITKIHKTVKDKVDGRIHNKGGNNNTFTDHIDYLILNKIANKGSIEGTIRQLAENFCLCNDEYGFLFEDIEGFSDELGIDGWYLLDFYHASRSQIKNIIIGSFDRLKKLGCIQYDQDKFAKGTDGISRMMSKEQLKQYEEIKNELILNMGVTSEQAIISRGEWKQFREHLKAATSFSMDIEFVYNAYIAVTHPLLRENLEVKLGELEEKYDDIDHCNELNRKLCRRIIDNAKKRHNKALGIGENVDQAFGQWDLKDKVKYRMSNEYVDEYRKMVDTFIKVDGDKKDVKL